MARAWERTTSCPTCGASRYVEVSGRGNSKKGEVTAPHCRPECPKS